MGEDGSLTPTNLSEGLLGESESSPKTDQQYDLKRFELVLWLLAGSSATLFSLKHPIPAVVCMDVSALMRLFVVYRYRPIDLRGRGPQSMIHCEEADQTSACVKLLSHSQLVGCGAHVYYIVAAIIMSIQTLSQDLQNDAGFTGYWWNRWDAGCAMLMVGPAIFLDFKDQTGDQSSTFCSLMLLSQCLTLLWNIGMLACSISKEPYDEGTCLHVDQFQWFAGAMFFSALLVVAQAYDAPAGVSACTGEGDCEGGVLPPPSA
jgi:hypothetical protein